MLGTRCRLVTSNCHCRIVAILSLRRISESSAIKGEPPWAFGPFEPRSSSPASLPVPFRNRFTQSTLWVSLLSGLRPAEPHSMPFRLSSICASNRAWLFCLPSALLRRGAKSPIISYVNCYLWGGGNVQMVIEVSNFGHWRAHFCYSITSADFLDWCQYFGGNTIVLIHCIYIALCEPLSTILLNCFSPSSDVAQ